MTSPTMPVTARLRYLRIAPRKVRLVANLVRGKSVEGAQTILSFTIKKAANPLLKLLNSAAASARNNFGLDPASLFISKITVDEGPKYKRWEPRARGQASEIQKKTSHITLVLDALKGKPKKIRKAKAEKLEEVEKVEGAPKKERIQKHPDWAGAEGQLKPKTEKGIKRIFRRKAF